MQFLIVNTICTIFVLMVLHYTWKFSSLIWEASFKYLRKWQKNPDIKPKTGFRGKLVMWNVKQILKSRYEDLPQVGDLIQGVASEKIYIVTHRYQPKPISPFGYIEVMRMEENNNTSTRIEVLDFFKDSYEKVTPDENDL